MIRTLPSLVRSLPGLLAVSIVCLLPAAAEAQTVIFRNECRASVIVQTATVVKGNVVRDQPQLLRSGDYTSKIKLDTDKIVTVYDAKSNQVLFREVLKVTKMDLGYSIHPDPNAPNKVRLKLRKSTDGWGGGAMDAKKPD
jgi:hypothetical protein